jgi:hypothetical protein
MLVSSQNRKQKAHQLAINFTIQLRDQLFSHWMARKRVETVRFQSVAKKA